MVDAILTLGVNRGAKATRSKGFAVHATARRLPLIRACIQAEISDSTQATERAPSAIGLGNSPLETLAYILDRLKPVRART